MANGYIQSLSDLETFSITGLKYWLQKGGSLMPYCMDYSASVRDQRQPVRVPYMLPEGLLSPVNPNSQFPANESAVQHAVIDWYADPDTPANTSFPLAVSYNEWEVQESGIAPSIVAQKTQKQAERWLQTFDSHVIADLKGAATANSGSRTETVAIANSAAITEDETKAIIRAAIDVMLHYWRIGYDRRTAREDIIVVPNERIINELLVYQATGQRGTGMLGDQAFIQAMLGPMLAGMTIAPSFAMDDTVTAAGDEYAFLCFMRNAVGYVSNDSPSFNERVNLTLERRVGYYRDFGSKLLIDDSVRAVKLNVTS